MPVVRRFIGYQRGRVEMKETQESQAFLVRYDRRRGGLKTPEHRNHNPGVGGSSPSPATNLTPE
jgi:hypothetical protein